MAKRAGLRADVTVPLTAREADGCLPLLAADYTELLKIIDRARKEKDRIIKEAMARAGAVIGRINQRKQGLKIFAERNRKELAKGKTISLPRGELYWRSGRLSVRVENPEDVIRAIEALGLADELLIIRKKVSKAGVLKHRASAEQIKGITITKGGERFYIRPRKLEVELPEHDSADIARLIMSPPKA